MEFSHLDPDMPDFIEDYPGSVAIPTITVEWTKSSVDGVFTDTQFPLNLNWTIIIHKSQGGNWDV